MIILENNTKLSTLQIKRNRIGANGLKDVEGLLNVPSLRYLLFFKLLFF